MMLTTILLTLAALVIGLIGGLYLAARAIDNAIIDSLWRR